MCYYIYKVAIVFYMQRIKKDEQKLVVTALVISIVTLIISVAALVTALNKPMPKELVDTFHQSSVLIQSNKTTTEFFSGGQE